MKLTNQTMPEALDFLTKGYIEYAHEVVTDRAIVGIDGLKPSQRRILYSMGVVEKAYDLTKSSTTAGAVMKFHPHGDGAVYDTMVRMVDKSEYTAIPFISGKGNFGKVYSDEKAAAARYTEVRINELGKEIFKDMDGVEFVLSYDDKNEEPTLLPIPFPNVLTTAQRGVAVGVSNVYPSFNYHEVLDATLEYLEKGFITKLLYPDFTTKGVVVKNDTEIREIMENGRGRIKIRGKWYVDGDTIVIEEIPYYTTIDTIKKRAWDIQGVKVVQDETGKGKLKITVECTSKKVVPDVLKELLRGTDLQMTVTTNMVVIIDGVPKVLGVYDLIAEWVRFRENVLTVSRTKALQDVQNKIERYEFLWQIILDEKTRVAFLTKLTKEGEDEARSFLRQTYPDVPEALIEWVLNLKVRQFTSDLKYAKEIEGLKEKRAQLQTDLSDIRQVIQKELQTLQKKHSLPRKTEITTEDYVLSKTAPKIKPKPIAVIVQVENNFLRKIRQTKDNDQLPGVRCTSDQMLSMVDSHGRILRVQLEHIDLHSSNEKGLYLPSHFGIADDFTVISYNAIEDKKLGYVYADGYVSVVDYAEWVNGTRMAKITERGLSPYAATIVGTFEFPIDYVLVETSRGFIGAVPTTFKQKQRSARTKLFSMRKDDTIQRIFPIAKDELKKLLPKQAYEIGKIIAISDLSPKAKTVWETIQTKGE